MIMEGVLLKWTNYYSGWQPRWFVLNDDGTLSYFNSRDEAKNGCRGSVNLALCEIVVHQHDPKRLDIIIPGEQHYSLKTNTSSDRSTWLRVLGSTKLVGKRKSNEADLVELVKTRRSEIRLYMDLILQQASEAHLALHQGDDKIAAQNSLNMLVTTVQVLSRSVDECLLLTSSFAALNGPSEAHLVISPSSTPGPVSKLLDTQSVSELPLDNVSQNSNPEGSLSPPLSYFNTTLGLALHSYKMPQTPGSSSSCDKLDVEESNSTYETPLSKDSGKPSTKGSVESDENSQVQKRPSDTPVTTKTAPVAQKYQYRSALRELDVCTFTDVEITVSGDIYVLPFVEASRSIIVILDRLKTSVLGPVRSDVRGNIDNIEAALKKYDGKNVTASECSIQTLIKLEMDAGKSTTDPSACVSLVWLVRGLQFVSLFLKFLADPTSNDARQCASEAYTKTLRTHHGILARSVFSIALQALPVKPSQFLTSIGGDDSNIDDIRQDILQYVSGLKCVLDVLQKFLDQTGLSKKM